MAWGEAVRLVLLLRNDPSSQLAAAVEGWKHPISREALILADLFDLDMVAAGVKKPEPHPSRPWDQDQRKKTHLGNAGGRSTAEVIDILTRAREGRLVD